MPRQARTAASPKPKQTRSLRSRPTPRWLTKQPDLDAVARNRVLMVLSVLSGEKPVTMAIEESGISRGFYYQLETKALNAMLLALAPGSDGDASPDATGLHHRIKELEEKVERAEQGQRRAERLLLVQRKLSSPGPVKTHRGRPKSSVAKKPTPSTPAGRSDWRSSTTTNPPKRRGRPPKNRVAEPPSPPATNGSASQAASTSSTPSTAGATVAP